MPGSGRTYRLFPLAEADLEEIWLYTFNNWSLEQADKYHAKYRGRVRGIGSRRQDRTAR